ncbi:hypothetical protein MHP7448_0707 [Mesomycoplasma hyopneumoniae 7448]|uniref:Transmembrane protein n=1 Tax=Mesomycoplasma hyopneumoniae (strain 7448) TaxID=262722 RepID=A4Q7X4_MESH7|nr:hypothetical protein MHP7448_0707 [Mesomycoplasma hyopneumoniae 7448]
MIYCCPFSRFLSLKLVFWDAIFVSAWTICSWLSPPNFLYLTFSFWLSKKSSSFSVFWLFSLFAPRKSRPNSISNSASFFVLFVRLRLVILAVFGIVENCFFSFVASNFALKGIVLAWVWLAWKVDTW